MSSYDALAASYDALTVDVEYRRRADYLTRQFHRSAFPVETVLDREPQLSAEQIRLALWMCQRYFCTFYDALHAILPIGLWYQHKELWHLKREPEGELPEKEQVLVSLLREKDRELSQLLEAQPKAKAMLQKLEQQGIVSCARASNRRVSDKTDWRVAFAITSQEAEELTRDKMRRAPRQGAALSFLLKNGETSLHDLIYYTGVQRKWVMKMGEEGDFSGTLAPSTGKSAADSAQR